MKIVAGLGNPGSRYETTRHNVGFLAVDRLIERWQASGPSTKYQGELYNTSFEGEKVLLVKPQTFMNLSGKCIASLFNFYQCSAEDLVVIYDDLDLNPMAIRLKKGGGAGGHRGIRSIDECLGRDHADYYRVRVGIGRPPRIESQNGGGMSPTDHVLLPFLDEELRALDPILDQVGDATEEVLRGNIQSAMNKYHSS